MHLCSLICTPVRNSVAGDLKYSILQAWKQKAKISGCNFNAFIKHLWSNSVALYCAYSNFRCETSLSHIMHMFEQRNSVQLSFLALHNPAVCHLQYLPLTNDLYLGKNMPPTELRMSVKQSDWKPSSLLYTPWINRQRARDEEWRYNDQIGEMWKIKNSGIMSVEEYILEDNRQALIWILIHQSVFALANSAVVAMPMPSSCN